MKRKSKTQTPEPKPKRLTIPEMKAKGVWLFAHLKDSDKVIAQGTQEQCRAYLQSRFMLGQLDEGHILLTPWKDRQRDPSDAPEVPNKDTFEELPPEHFLD